MSAAVHALAEAGNASAAALHTKDLCAALAAHHPGNAALALRLLSPIARLACGDAAVLTHTVDALERLQALCSTRGGSVGGNVASSVALELARQRLLLGEPQVRLQRENYSFHRDSCIWGKSYQAHYLCLLHTTAWCRLRLR